MSDDNFGDTSWIDVLWLIFQAVRINDSLISSLISRDRRQNKESRRYLGSHSDNRNPRGVAPSLDRSSWDCLLMTIGNGLTSNLWDSFLIDICGCISACKTRRKTSSLLWSLETGIKTKRAGGILDHTLITGILWVWRHLLTDHLWTAC